MGQRRTPSPPLPRGRASKRLDIGSLSLANVTFAVKPSSPVTGTLDVATMRADTMGNARRRRVLEEM